MQILIVAIVAVSFVVFLYTAVKLVSANDHHENEIPGPKKLPVIGNLHLLVGRSLPHRVFRDLAAKYGPLMRLQLGHVPFFIVSSVEVAEQVLKTHDVVFANRPPHCAAMPFTYECTDIAMSPHGEYWRQLRKICTVELLSARRVRSFLPIREEENARVVRSLASKEGSPANLSEIIFRSSLDITTRASVGKEENQNEKLLTTAVKQITEIGTGLSLADFYPSIGLLPYITGFHFKIQRLFRHTDRILGRIINQHRASASQSNGVEQSEDLVDVLLKYQNDDAGAQSLRLTTDNIKAVLVDIFLGGGDTSAAIVEWAMSEMIRNPSILKKAQDEVRQVLDDKGYVDEEKFSELKYLKLVIKETFRLHTPVPLLVPRQNSERCEINGNEIPAGSRVMVNAWALGRDPKYWDDAEKFKPERFEESSIDFKGNNLEFIPFGAGRRMCPGMAFGMANVEFPLATLLYYFDWKMPNGMRNEDLDMTEAPGATLTRKHGLMLIPTLKRPLTIK